MNFNTYTNYNKSFYDLRTFIYLEYLRSNFKTNKPILNVHDDNYIYYKSIYNDLKNTFEYIQVTYKTIFNDYKIFNDIELFYLIMKKASIGKYIDKPLQQYLKDKSYVDKIKELNNLLSSYYLTDKDKKYINSLLDKYKSTLERIKTDLIHKTFECCNGLLIDNPLMYTVYIKRINDNYYFFIVVNHYLYIFDKDYYNIYTIDLYNEKIKDKNVNKDQYFDMKELKKDISILFNIDFGKL